MGFHLRRKNKASCTSLVLLALTTLSLAGCKVQITVPEGGSVTSVSGAYACESGQVCTIDINDVFFDEEFVGEPAPGYRFVHWRKVKRGLCWNRTQSCRMVSGAALFHESFMELLASDEVFHLEPVFIADSVDTTYTGFSSRELPISLTVRESAIIHVDFTFQQLGEIPPDPDCRHEISVDLTAPVNADGTFEIDVSVPPQTSESGKLQLAVFEGRLSGSLGMSDGYGRWNSDELDIFCEKSTGETLHNFCGESFFRCIDAFNFEFTVQRSD